MKKLIYVVFTISLNANAGMFLDLDIGTHLREWPGQTCELTYVKKTDGFGSTAVCVDQSKYLSDSGPIAVIRAGYETSTYPVWGPVDISAHAYWEHISSAGDPNDTGIDLLMIGIRLE